MWLDSSRRVSEHLADARELVLPVERKDHPEQPVELGALHALAEDEDVAGEQALVLRPRQVEVAAQGAGGAGDELVLAEDRRDVLEHRLALVRIDLQRGDHVEEGIRVDVLLVGVAPEHQLELRGRHQFPHHVLDVVPDDALGRREVADAHPDDPALDLRHRLLVAPLLDVLPHRDILRFPVVGLHRPVKVVGPLVLERQEVEGHRLPAVDHLFRGERGLRLVLVEEEGLGADLEGLLHGAVMVGNERERAFQRRGSGGRNKVVGSY